jgi:hypothetical protein
MKLAQIDQKAKSNILKEVESTLSEKNLPWYIPLPLIMQILKHFALDKALEGLDRILPEYWYNFVTDELEGIALGDSAEEVKESVSKTLNKKIDIPVIDEDVEYDIIYGIVSVIYFFAQKGYSALK